MNTYLSIIPRVIPVFVLLAIGYFFKVKQFIDQDTTAELKKIIINFSLPAVLFTSFLTVSFRIEFLLIILLVFLVNLLMLFIGKKVSILNEINDPHFSLLFTGFEVGMLGIPLFGAIYGIGNIKYIGVIDIGQEFYVWFVLFAILLSLQPSGKKRGFNSLLKSFVSSPIIIAIFLGIILNSTGVAAVFSGNFIFSAIINSLELLGSITIPLFLIIIGYEINFKKGKLSLPLKIIFTRLIILIPLALLLAKWIFINMLNLNIMYSLALISVFILPPPFIIPLFINEEEREGKTYIYNTLSLSTIISIAVFVIIAVISRLYL